MASLECCAWRREASAFTADPEQWATTYVDERMLGCTGQSGFRHVEEGSRGLPRSCSEAGVAYVHMGKT